MANPDLVAKWLMRLGRATSASISDEQAERWFETVGPMLAERFADDAFTVRSLEHVASESRFLPNYAELVERLRAWRSQQGNDAPASDAPRVTGPTRKLSPDDQACVAVWLRRRGANSIENIPMSLHMLRDARPEVFRHLVVTDNDCWRIAATRGWLPRDLPAATIVPLRPAS